MVAMVFLGDDHGDGCYGTALITVFGEFKLRVEAPHVFDASTRKSLGRVRPVASSSSSGSRPDAAACENDDL